MVREAVERAGALSGDDLGPAHSIVAGRLPKRLRQQLGLASG